ncbi:chromosome transmission fidelity protein 8 homolog isoform X2 [Periplaneta americana]|uniref:chromosome transmission fidelity protein 8 homolog isoform X2 n=1 Tax=Periplaneta americana TaxID=6978 RepID=UPI0037E89385
MHQRSDSPVEEWAVVELQGDLESRDNENFHEQFIGDLHYTKKEKPVLIIGHHILHGNVVPMDKPFAVIERKSESDDDHDREDAVSCDVQKKVEYYVKAVVKKKLLFSDRPKPIIANVPKTV